MSNPAPPPPGVPAGWYPDGVNGQRYWDGDAWTDHRAPLTTTAPAKRSRNYVGDVALVLAIVGLILQVTNINALLVWGAELVALILSIAAIATARGTKSRVTAIIALVISALVVGYVILGVLYLTSTR